MLLAVRCYLLAGSCWLLVLAVSWQLLALSYSCYLSVASCQLSALICQLLAVSCKVLVSILAVLECSLGHAAQDESSCEQQVIGRPWSSCHQPVANLSSTAQTVAPGKLSVDAL